MNQRPKYILPLIIFSQFAGTSIWFAGNAILPDLITEFGLGSNDLTAITSAVQLGFIVGTLLFAIFMVSDRFSPSKVFFISSLLGALSNFLLIYFASSFSALLGLRFFTGLMLAGIYPIGMKIASDWYKEGLGKALGYLVGALVLGTAFPHLIKSFGHTFDWKTVITIVSVLSAFGGFLVLLFIGDGPFRKPLSSFQLKLIFTLFKTKEYKSAVFGYFGHMWELYTFWAFVPFILAFYARFHSLSIDISWWSFFVIAIGALGCIVGGLVSLKKGSANVAFYHLLISGFCILIFPLAIRLSEGLFMTYLLIWGWAVVADSPQFSTLSAKHAPSNLIGTGLTIMNSIGFLLTIVSMYLLKFALAYISLDIAILILLIGPLFGLIAIFKLKEKSKEKEHII